MGKNVIQLGETSTTSGAWFEITIPDGIGGYLSKRISFENLAVAIKQGITIENLTDISAAFTKAFDSGVKLLYVDFIYVSGGTDVKIKIGTSLGGTQISLAELPVPEDGNLPVHVNKDFNVTDTLYFSISGGVVDIAFLYIANYF